MYNIYCYIRNFDNTHKWIIQHCLWFIIADYNMYWLSYASHWHWPGNTTLVDIMNAFSRSTYSKNTILVCRSLDSLLQLKIDYFLVLSQTQCSNCAAGCAAAPSNFLLVPLSFWAQTALWCNEHFSRNYCKILGVC